MLAISTMGVCMSNQWFRMYAEFSSDPKVQSMSEAMQRRLVMLFCLHASGDFEKLTREEIAFALRNDDVTLHETLQLFHQKGFCDENGNLKNWNKRQYKSDSSVDRVKKYRDNKKKYEEKTDGNKNVTTMKRYSNADVTPPDTEADTDTEIEDSLRSSSKKNQQKKSSDSDIGKIHHPPPDIPPDLWKDFLAVRQKLKAVNSERAIGLLHAELEKLKAQGQSPSAVIEQSIRNSWKDIYPIRNQGGTHAASSNRNGNARAKHSGFEQQDYTAGTEGFIVT